MRNFPLIHLFFLVVFATVAQAQDFENPQPNQLFWEYYGPGCNELHNDPTLPAIPGTIRIPVRIIRIQSGGTLPFTDNEIDEMFQYAKDVFAGFQINLDLQTVIVPIDDASLYDFVVGDFQNCPSEGDWLLLKNLIDGLNTATFQPLNIVFTNSVKTCSNSTNLEGVARFPIQNPPAVMVSNNSEPFFGNERKIGLVHELGHFFGLLHTFYDLEGGYLCGRGDLIGDTPPLRNGITACHIPPFTCTFSNLICSDITPEDGQKAFDNYMSYNGDCRKEFTPFQMRKMYDIAANGNRPDVCRIPEAPTVSVLGGTTIPLGHSIQLQAEVSAANGSNSANAVSWIIQNGTATYEVKQSPVLVLPTGNGQIISSPGTYQICAQDVSPYNQNCRSELECITITVTATTSDWVLAESGVTNYLYDIFFINPQTGWIVGANETILRTTDGGNSWVRQRGGGTPIRPTLRSVHFINTLEGWAAGDDGTIFKTTDSGQTWTSQVSGTTTDDLNDIFFVNSNVGFIAGDLGDFAIMKTTDGGETWTPTAVSRYMNSVFFPNSNTGFFVGSSGAVIATPDGGNSFSVPDLGTSAELWEVNFIDADNGYISGNDAFFYTINGGTTWTRQNSYLGSGYSLFFTDPLTGFVLESREVKSTSNRGASWTSTSLASIIIGDPNALSFADPENGFIVGNAGMILRYSPSAVSNAKCLYYDVGIYGTTTSSFQSQNSITSTAQIAPASNITFRAATSITLQPGFHTEAGSAFLARIEDCLTPAAAPPALVSRPAIEKPKEKAPEGLSLTLSPNPFTNETTFRYFLAEPSYVTLHIADLTGRPVQMPLATVQQEAGWQEYRFQAGELPAGLYFVTVMTGNIRETKPLYRLL